MGLDRRRYPSTVAAANKGSSGDLADVSHRRVSPGRRWLSAVPGGLLAYVLMRPVSNGAILYPVLAGMFGIAFVTALVRRQVVERAFFPIIFLQLAFAAYGTITGVVADTPGWTFELVIYFVPPLIFWTCVAALDLRTLTVIFMVMAMSAAVLSTGIVLYVFAELGYLPAIIPPVVLDQFGAGFGAASYAPAIRLYSLSTLVALGPIWVASLALPRADYLPRLGFRAYCAIASLAAALLSGRRALLVVMLFAPILMLLVNRWLSGPPSPRARPSLRVVAQVAPYVLLVVALSGAAAAGVVGPHAIGTAVSDTIATVAGNSGPGSSVDTAVRQEESTQLLSGWSQAPVTGNGFGAVIGGYTRNDDRPWEFELQYQLLLFQTGLIGVALLLVVVVKAALILRSIAIQAPWCKDLLSLALVGTLSMLIANAADPYLHAVGHLWALYLPFGVASVGMATIRANAAMTTMAPVEQAR